MEYSLKLLPYPVLQAAAEAYNGRIRRWTRRLTGSSGWRARSSRAIRLREAKEPGFALVWRMKGHGEVDALFSASTSRYIVIDSQREIVKKGELKN